MTFSVRSGLVTLIPVAVSFAVLFAVNLLPADTALEEINASGRLTVCAPPELGPLIAPDPARPGFEIALVEEAARRAGWRTAITSNAAMAREFNPANWRISRATCRVIVGGLRDNSWSRSLMEMGRPYLSSTWVWTGQEGVQWPPATAGFSPGIFAMDRITLGTFLRKEGVRVMPVQKPDQLVQALQSGQVPAVITDSITADFLFHDGGQEIAPLPAGPAPEGIAMGFWKGDTTLRRHMDAILAEMAADGTLARLAADYGIAGSLTD